MESKQRTKVTKKKLFSSSVEIDSDERRGRVKSTEHELLPATKTGRKDNRAAPGFASTFPKPESGPDLSAPC